MKEVVAAGLALLLTSTLTTAAEKTETVLEKPIAVKIEKVQGHSAGCRTVYHVTNKTTSTVYDMWATWEEDGQLWCRRYYAKIEKLAPGESRFLGCDEDYSLMAVKEAPATNATVAVASDLSPRR